MTSSTQVAVIGGGPGGYAAAFLAADLGRRVVLIDEAPNPGGVCLYRGCMPSKALLHVAKVVTEAREARNWGVDFGEPALDIDRLRSWKDQAVARLTGGLGQLSTQRGGDLPPRARGAVRTDFGAGDGGRRQGHRAGVRACDSRHRVETGGARRAVSGQRPGLGFDPGAGDSVGARVPARGRRRLYRARAGVGLCRARLEGDGGRDDRRAVAGCRPRTSWRWWRAASPRCARRCCWKPR